MAHKIGEGFFHEEIQRCAAILRQRALRDYKPIDPLI